MSLPNLKIIQSAINKSATGVEKNYSSVIKPHIANHIEIKRAEVGANLFSKCCGDNTDQGQSEE